MFVFFVSNQVPMDEHINGEAPHDGQERQMSDEDILKELAKIACRNNMSHKCLRDVARLFKRSGRPQLKTDPRAILKTKTTTVGDANFVHLGLVKGLLLKISKGVLRTHQVNVLIVPAHWFAQLISSPTNIKPIFTLYCGK